MKPTFITLLTLVFVVGCGTPYKGTTHTSNVKIGTPIWVFETGSHVPSSPAIDSDGTVYVGSYDNKLYAIKTDSKGPANIANPIVEKEVRRVLDKPEGELTEADLAKVTYLSLIGTKITDAGLREVANLQKLKELNLYLTQITDAGLKEVAKLKQLKVLNLASTKITDAGLIEVAKLQKALPKCYIASNATK